MARAFGRSLPELSSRGERRTGGPDRRVTSHTSSRLWRVAPRNEQQERGSEGGGTRGSGELDLTRDYDTDGRREHLRVVALAPYIPPHARLDPNPFQASDVPPGFLPFGFGKRLRQPSRQEKTTLETLIHAPTVKPPMYHVHTRLTRCARPPDSNSLSVCLSASP